MRPAWLHVNALDLITRDLILFNLAVLQIAHLDQAMTVNHNEDLPLALMPVLTLCDTGLADVDGHLPVVQCADQFGEAATLVDIHLVIEDGLLFRKIGQVHRIKLFLKAAGRERIDDIVLREIMELMEKIDDFA